MHLSGCHRCTHPRSAVTCFSVIGLDLLHTGSSVVEVPIPIFPFLLPYLVYPSLFLLQWMDKKSLKPKLPHWIMGFVWHLRISLDNFVQ